MTAESIELLRRYVDSYNDRSLPDEADAIFDSDLVVVNEAAEVETEGIEAYLEHAYQGWIEAVPDARVELVDYEVDERMITCTLQSGGTFDGTLETPKGPIPGTGKPFELELRIEAVLDEGRISRWVSTYDVEDWQQQVGLNGMD